MASSSSCFSIQCSISGFLIHLQVQHRIRDHRHERGPTNWLKLEGELLEEANTNAREINDFLHHMSDLQPFVSNPADSVWLCSHCLDLPQEKECYELSKIKDHLLTRHVLLLFPFPYVHCG